MPRWSGHETSSVAVGRLAHARQGIANLEQKKAPRAGAGGPAAFGAATASALSGRWRWEPASPLPRFEIRLVALGRRHLTRRSTALVHRITSVSAWGTSSGAQTPPPDRFPRWSPLPPLPAAPPGRLRPSGTRGRVRSPAAQRIGRAAPTTGPRRAPFRVRSRRDSIARQAGSLEAARDPRSTTAAPPARPCAGRRSSRTTPSKRANRTGVPLLPGRRDHAVSRQVALRGRGVPMRADVGDRDRRRDRRSDQRIGRQIEPWLRWEARAVRLARREPSSRFDSADGASARGVARSWKLASRSGRARRSR